MNSTISNRLPYWFKQAIPDKGVNYFQSLLAEFGINTVCKEAKCPNLSQCFKNKELTFMILGPFCTRACKFCAVLKKEKKVLGLDLNEAQKISYAVKRLGLKYVVVTSVTRDDLLDGGAQQFAETIHTLNKLSNDILIEVLIPDFLADYQSINIVVSQRPSVIAHNLETVKRLSKELRPQADYERSLKVLSIVKKIDKAIITKSSLILGLGETENEVIGAMKDLRNVDCDILTLGQYLAPSKEHYPVKEFIGAEQFLKYKTQARQMGFRAVLSEPKARSSYNAQVLYKECI